MKWIKYSPKSIPPKSVPVIFRGISKPWNVMCFNSDYTPRPDIMFKGNDCEWLDESEDDIEASIRSIEIELWQNKKISEEQYNKALPHINSLLEICKVTHHTENNQ